MRHALLATIVPVASDVDQGFHARPSGMQTLPYCEVRLAPRLRRPCGHNEPCNRFPVMLRRQSRSAFSEFDSPTLCRDHPGTI
jgi:hypothetical protein